MDIDSLEAALSTLPVGTSFTAGRVTAGWHVTVTMPTTGLGASHAHAEGETLLVALIAALAKLTR